MAAKVSAYWALTRGYMSLILGLAAICGALLAGGHVSTRVLVLLCLGQAAIAAGGFAVNDLLDLRRDRGVRWKPLVTGRLSVIQAQRAACILCGVGLTVSGLCGWAPCAIACGQLGIVFGYSALKRWSGFAANWTTAALCASGFLYGAAVASRLGLAWIPALLTLEFTLAREMVKDIVDMGPDEAAQLPTVPLRYGLATTSVVVCAVVCLTAATSMLPEVRNALGPGYTACMGVVDAWLVLASVLLVRRPKQAAQPFLLATAAVLPLALLAFVL